MGVVDLFDGHTAHRVGDHGGKPLEVHHHLQAGGRRAHTAQMTTPQNTIMPTHIRHHCPNAKWLPYQNITRTTSPVRPKPLRALPQR